MRRAWYGRGQRAVTRTIKPKSVVREAPEDGRSYQQVRRAWYGRGQKAVTRTNKPEGKHKSEPIKFEA